MNGDTETLARDPVMTEARRWVVRLDELTGDDRRALDSWLQGSDAHRAAFDTACKEWQDLGFLRRLQQDAPEHGDPWVARKRARRAQGNGRPARRRFLPAVAAAAATVAAIALAGWWLLPADYHADYSTAIGEQRTVNLPDNSAIILNTNTRLAVYFSGEERTVHFEYGEAHFEVGHDLSRPFVVIAGGGVVRALGTAFSVHLREEQVEVTVTDGEVEISQRPPEPAPDAPAPASVAKADRPAPAQRLTKGHNAKITTTIEAIAPVDPEVLERELAWHHGMLVFVNAPLGEVIAEAGRYTAKSLQITDPELESYPVTIVAKASNIDGLLRNLDESTDAFDVRNVSGQRVLISAAQAD